MTLLYEEWSAPMSYGSRVCRANNRNVQHESSHVSSPLARPQIVLRRQPRGSSAGHPVVRARSSTDTVARPNIPRKCPPLIMPRDIPSVRPSVFRSTHICSIFAERSFLCRPSHVQILHSQKSMSNFPIHYHLIIAIQMRLAHHDMRAYKYIT